MSDTWQDVQADFNERAAILEYDNHLTRTEAEAQAVRELVDQLQERTRPQTGIVAEHDQRAFSVPSALDLIDAKQDGRSQARQHLPRVQALRHQVNHGSAFIHRGDDGCLMSLFIGFGGPVGIAFGNHCVETPGGRPHVSQSESDQYFRQVGMRSAAISAS